MVTAHRRPVIVGIVLAVIATLFVTSNQPADAVSASDWKAGSIISDAKFFDGNAMTAPQVQDFLNSKGSSCVAGAMPCLKNYAMATPAIPYEANICYSVGASGGLTAAQIIDVVARACGISQKVILVTLQKESGLVTKTKPTTINYRSATGFGCPDTAPCDAQYYGFFNQVYRMARQFKVYTTNPTRYGYQKGRNNNILYNPNAGCGSSSVYIENQATANLYIYTPYQPNAAALANMNGTGDSCSAYGNRNFWRFYSDWFGAAAAQRPVGTVDSVVATGSTVSIGGWTFDPDTTAKTTYVATYRDDQLVSWNPTNVPRPDVNQAFGIIGSHGYAFALESQPAGVHTYCMYAADTDGSGNYPLGCKTVQGSQAPYGGLDAATAAGSTVTLSGWSLDPDIVGSSIYVATYNSSRGLVGWTIAGQPRPDVNAALGGIPGNYGYTVQLTQQPAGEQAYCVYAADHEGGGNFLLGCKSVQVPTDATTPIGRIDGSSVSGQTVTLSGWALDPNYPASAIYVATYSSTQGLVAWTPTTVNRPDVNGMFGASGPHGFTITLPNRPHGPQNLCIYGANGQGENYLLGCVYVSIP